MDVAGDDRAYAWQLDEQLWAQTGDSTFTLVNVAGVTPDADLVDLDYAVGAKRAPSSSTDAYLPADFAFCPLTGQKLAPVAYQKDRRWLPPYGNGSGRRVVDDECDLDSAERTLASLYQHLLASPGRDLDSSKQALAAPRKNGLNFFVGQLGGHRDALFSLSREGGLFLWQRGSHKWLAVLPRTTPIGRTSLENWAWGVALQGEGREQKLIVAGDEGATRVSVDPLALSYQVDRCAGRALGAPGDLAEHTFVPLALADGSVCLASPGAEGGWTQHPVANATAAQMNRLSAPLRDPASRRLLWIGEQGYLVAQLGESVQAQWLPWPIGATAKPELGPPFLDGYGWWQLLFDADGQSYLRLGSQERRTIKGTRLGTGHLNYMFNVRLDQPWDEHDEHNNPMTREVRYPFIEFSRDRLLLSLRVNRDSGSVQSLFDSDAAVDSEFCLERIGEVALRLPLKVSKPWNAQWFFFDQALWLYIDSSGALFRWKA